MSDESIWKEYMEKNFEKFITSLTSEDFIDGKKEAINFKELDLSGPKLTYDFLRTTIKQDAIKKLQNRFRAHKHRENKGIKNLQLKSHSLNLLNKFKAQVDAESLEEAIDFLLSPDYRDYKYDVNHAKQQLGEEKFNGTDLMLESFAKRLNNYDRERLLLIIERAFKEGWKAGKQNRRRTGDPCKEALDKSELYINVAKLKG